VWALKDEVMLGPALLVAPVVTAATTHRPVVFPSARFAPFAPLFNPNEASGIPSSIAGPVTLDIHAERDQIPVYIVAGGIVPLTATPADTLLPHQNNLAGLETTEGDRVVIVGLGADGTFTEESGASYELTGTGTTAPASNEPDGAVVVTGNQTVSGTDFTFTTSGQPDARTIRVLFE
jgi:alpha-glucosidase (family GH31 glycosyl hydrolase)